MIEIRDLRFAFPGSSSEVLAIDTLSVNAGETVFLHGPSGSGKSTLLALLAGVLVPSSGSVRVLGTAWSHLRSAERDRFRADHVGVIFQQFNLLPYLGVLDNVLLACRFSPRRTARAAEAEGSAAVAAQALLREVGLEEALWRRPAAQLSVGQQQRVAAARAVIGGPELILADEPTSALDEARRRSFVDLLLAECTAARTTLVFVSHDERLATRFDRRIALAEINRASTPVEQAA